MPSLCFVFWTGWWGRQQASAKTIGIISCPLELVCGYRIQKGNNMLSFPIFTQSYHILWRFCFPRSYGKVSNDCSLNTTAELACSAMVVYVQLWHTVCEGALGKCAGWARMPNIKAHKAAWVQLSINVRTQLAQRKQSNSTTIWRTELKNQSILTRNREMLLSKNISMLQYPQISLCETDQYSWNHKHNKILPSLQY